MIRTLPGGFEGWLGSPAVADLDGNGRPEIVAARDGFIYTWHADGTLFWKAAFGYSATASPKSISGRIWGPPVVGDFEGRGRISIAAGSHQGKVTVSESDGALKAGWPVSLGSAAKIRSLAAGRFGNDVKLALLASRTASDPTTVLLDSAGKVMPGWPQLSSTHGCAPAVNCFEAGTYNQNVSIADLDGDEKSNAMVQDRGAFILLNHQGKELARVALPCRGSMAAPTLADLDGDDGLEVIINLKDATSQGGVQIYEISEAKENRLIWPTARGNFLRNGDATH